MRKAKGLFSTIDWRIVRNDGRQMGLLIIGLVIISSALPLEINLGRAAIAFTIGLAMWLFGVLEPRDDGSKVK